METVPNGFGGAVGTDVEHVPNRFSSGLLPGYILYQRPCGRS